MKMNQFQEQDKVFQISYKFKNMLNELGVKCWDFKNADNCRKIQDVEKQILELVKALPKVSK